LEPFSLVFSTGSKLDSLGCQGRLTNAFSGEPVKDALVMLYRDDIDSLPKSTLPRYFARTNEAGQYEIQNVKSGNYKLFALKDQNSNYLYDQPGELIGFPEHLISIDSAKTPIPEIRLSAEVASDQRLVKSEFEEPGMVTLKYSIAPDTVYFTDFSGNSLQFFLTEESKRDSLNFLFKRFEGDSVKLFAHSYLGGQGRVDTLEFRAKKVKPLGRKGSRNTAKDTSLAFSSSIEAKKLLPSEKLILKSNYPCQLSDSANFNWIIAGDTTVAALPVSLSPFNFEFIPPSAESKAIYLIGASGSFIDIYGHSSDTIKTDFRVMEEDETGNLEILVFDSTNTDKVVILELTDSKGAVKFKKSISGNDSLLIRNLRPGTLKLRAIVDANSNGKWDPANYNLKTQPELVYRYSEEITIRAGWDLAVEWDIFARPVQKKRPDKPASE
ncbi:MAG: carboxypeptidase-like regulatory domain-containing protein, partial [Bacteroidia bacterium]